MRRRQVAAALMPALLLACYDPVYPAHLACSTSLTCPPTQTCNRGTGACEPTPGASLADASLASTSADAVTSVVVASAGPDRTVRTGLPLNLDGTASHDSQPLPLTYAWTITTAPAGTPATLSETGTATPIFTPFVDGSYVLTLLVSAGDARASDSVTITARDDVVVVSAGEDVATNTGTPVSLRGRASGPNADALTYGWTVISRPDGSGAQLSGTGTLTPTLAPDVDGAYVVHLTVGGGVAETTSDTVTVTSYHPIAPLTHRVIDAEVSRPLARIVMVDANPDVLYLYDPTSGAETQVALPLDPNAVSVSPDGRSAAVSHDASVSYVDLVEGKLVKTCSVSLEVQDVVLAGNRVAYAFPGVTTGSIHSLDLVSCEDTSSDNYLWPGSVAKLHPDGDRLYVADNTDYEIGLFVLDIANGSPSLSVPPSYYDNCHNLWLTEDGSRIVTACGYTFFASKNASTDATYAGMLSGITRIVHADHSTRAGKILVLPTANSDAPPLAPSVRIYDQDSLDLEGERLLTKFCDDGTAFLGHGRFVFVDPDGVHYHVVLQADPTAKLSADFGVATYPL